MDSFGNILIFHAGAIGDTLLATPVSAALKLNYPGAKITYWTHPILKDILLGLCPSIDEVMDFDRDASVFDLARTFSQFRPDLFIDLTNSNKSKLMTLFSGVKTLRYVKQAANARPIRHAAENFLDTVRPICPEIADKLFPTIFPDAISEEVLDRILEEHDMLSYPLIGIVAGVGKIRPHRAWVFECWTYLIEHIFGLKKYLPVLVGGHDEIELAKALNDSVGGKCLNLVGKLSLSETAAILKRCKVIVSGDTGPAHMSVAVGTRVIGLYGPTFPERSGPFGCMDLVLDQSDKCECHDVKVCRFTNPADPGQCMSRIMLAEVIDRLDGELGLKQPGNESGY
jgi:ADP-heptose:LPS heptosyltransferase